MWAWDFRLVVISDMFYDHKAEIDISTYISFYKELKYKLNLEVRGSVRKFIKERLIETGLYRKSSRNSLGSIIIDVESNLSSKMIDISEDLLRFDIKREKHTRRPTQTEFWLSHSNEPALLI